MPPSRDYPFESGPGVYILQVGDRHYVGSTKNLRQRFIQHKSKMLRGRHENPLVRECFAKWGSFSMRVVSRSALGAKELERELTEGYMRLGTSLNRRVVSACTDGLRESISESHHDVSGKKNPRYDSTQYLWFHPDLGVASATGMEMRELHGLTPQGVSSVKSGRQRTTKGWRIAGFVRER